MKISQPVPELPVPDVKAAQRYYRDYLGFDMAWYDEAGGIGAVSHGNCAIFFRKADSPITVGRFWVFTQDVDDTYAKLTRTGANITAPIADTAWGMRQFTVKDVYGNTFYFHHDL